MLGRWLLVVQSFLVTAAVLAAVALPVQGCAQRHTKEQAFDYWTRYYEARMGLDASTIVHDKTPAKKCAQIDSSLEIGKYGLVFVVRTYYDAGRWPCRSPWDLALHEACHRRMQHHLLTEEFFDVAEVDVEAEAKECERWYK